MEKKITKLGEICFWIGLLIELILVIIDKSAYINPWEGQLFRLTFLLFCIKIATTKYTRKEWLCILFFGAIAMISYLINDKDEVVRVVAFIAACKDIPLKREMKVVLAITAVGSVILFLLAIFGVFGNMTMTANFGRGPFPGIVETRYCFGMGHPNAFQCMLLMITILILYSYGKEMKLYHFFLLFAVNYLSYRFTDSNTGFLVAGAILIGVMLLKYSKLLQNAKIIYMLGAMLFVAVVVFSAVGSHLGRETELMYDIDQILNGRFQYAHVIEDARIENWKLFGDVNNTEYFDSGFIRLFYWYGIMPGLLYIFAHLYLFYESYKEKDYILMVVLVGLSIFMIMEAHMISYYILRNYVFIWLGYYWYQELQGKQEIALLTFFEKKVNRS